MLDIRALRFQLHKLRQAANEANDAQRAGDTNAELQAGCLFKNWADALLETIARGMPPSFSYRWIFPTRRGRCLSLTMALTCVLAEDFLVNAFITSAVQSS